jgi:hypothetical protein
MSTHYNAMQTIVEAANIAMAEIADAGQGRRDDSDAFREVWEPVAKALWDSIPEEFARDWPAEFAAADAAGADFIGVTSDTRKVVIWGVDRGGYRDFLVINNGEKLGRPD